MSFLNRLKQGAQSLSSSLSTEITKFNNADFANATMAMCALITAADQHVSPEERARVAQFIGSNDLLRSFNVADLQGKYNAWLNKLQADYDFGRIEALQAIGKLRSKPDQARAMLQVGIVIGKADGTFDPQEIAQVRAAAQAVNLDPTEFGV